MAEDNIIRINDFCLFTFHATSHALKAEKVLKAENFEFIVIPTLREISTSCGLSIKVRPEKYEEANEILTNHKVPVDAIYKVEKQGKKHLIEKLA